MRARTLSLAVCVLMLLAGGARGQGLPGATMPSGAFAFPDLSGTRLLTVGDVPQPALLHTALCDGSHRFPVRFAHRQSDREGHNGRQTPANFDMLAGNVYTVLQGTIDIRASCFLASDRVLSSATVLPAEPSAELRECDPESWGRLASAQRRPVVHCWLIARPTADKRVLLVEFARQAEDALASVVLLDGSRAIRADYPAVFKGAGHDLWRVNDGGVLSPEGFHVVFLLQRGTSYTLGVNWFGGEGASLAVFASNGDSQFTPVINDYWYQAPF